LFNVSLVAVLTNLTGGWAALDIAFNITVFTDLSSGGVAVNLALTLALYDVFMNIATIAFTLAGDNAQVLFVMIVTGSVRHSIAANSGVSAARTTGLGIPLTVPLPDDGHCRRWVGCCRAKCER
jgi:hypothetical protein